MMKLRTTKFSSSPRVEGIDIEDIYMVEDMATEVGWLKESMIVWCWRDIGSMMERRGVGELIGNGRSLRSQGVQKGHTTFISLDSNCSTLHRVEKSVKEIENEMKCVLNELKSWGYLYGGGE
jgi:hypothetical protein